MNKELLETTLNVALKDKKCANYFMHQEIERVIQKLFDETEPNLKAHIWVFRQDNRSAYFDIKMACPRTLDKSINLCTIEVKRTRDWRDDYYYKSFRVCQDEIDIDKTIESHFLALKRDDEKRTARLNTAREDYQAIKNLHPTLNKGAIRNLIRNLNDCLYTIEDEFWEEN